MFDPRSQPSQMQLSQPPTGNAIQATAPTHLLNHSGEQPSNHSKIYTIQGNPLMMTTDRATIKITQPSEINLLPGTFTSTSQHIPANGYTLLHRNINDILQVRKVMYIHTNCLAVCWLGFTNIGISNQHENNHDAGLAAYIQITWVIWC